MAPDKRANTVKREIKNFDFPWFYVHSKTLSLGPLFLGQAWEDTDEFDRASD